MDKSLICRIEVTTNDGLIQVGTGYSVAANRILTAAHVVENADRFRLEFGEHNELHEPTSPPKVCWNGMEQGCNGKQNIDVAVIDCQLPQKLIPRDMILARGHVQRADYESCGFGASMKGVMDNRMFDFHGSLPVMTGDYHQVLAESYSGPNPIERQDVDQTWGGVSGSSLFECRDEQRLLAVLTAFVLENNLPTVRAVPLPFLLGDEAFCEAVHQARPLNYQDLEQLSIQRLQDLAAELLSESEVLRKFIISCNSVASDLNGEALAKKIFQERPPMTVLRKCVQKPKIKEKLSDDERSELNRTMCRLAAIVSPVSIRRDNLRHLHQHSQGEATHAELGVCDKTTAVSRVAFVKQVSARLDFEGDWKVLDDRNVAGAVPAPPEMGFRKPDQPSDSESAIELLAAGLRPMINPAGSSIAHLRAGLRNLAKFQCVYLCVIFDLKQSETSLREMHDTFPDLILLVADTSKDPHDDDADIADHVHRVRKEFCPTSEADKS